MIGGGLALNDTRFILVQATCPTSSGGSVGDFIPEPRCSKSVVGLQTRRRNEGCTVGPVRRAEIDRSYAMNEVSNPKHELEEVDLGELPVFRGSTSPFIEEGDGFTSERESEYGRF